MKKSFTLLELIIVIVIASIIITISADIINKSYLRYKKEEAINKLINKVNIKLDILGHLLKSRIKNSTIALKCNVDNNDCYNGNISNWKRLSEVKPSESNDYPGVEFITYDPNIFRGAWDNDHMQLGYSQMIDLKASNQTGNGTYTIKSLNSNFDIIKKLEKEKLISNGILTIDPFLEKKAVIIFSGPDGRGVYLSKNNSFGYYGTNPDSIYQITNYNQSNETTSVDIKELHYNPDVDIYERYFIADNTIALIPKKQSNNFYSLYIFDNYYPWLNQTYSQNGTSHLFIKNIADFFLKEDLNKIIVKLCLIDPNLKDDNGKYIQICRERIVN